MHISKKENASKYENKDVIILEEVANLVMTSSVNPSDKAKLVKASDGKSMRNLASQFDSGKDTESDIKKKRNAYLDSLSQNKS